jgi:hypothetical protein
VLRTTNSKRHHTKSLRALRESFPLPRHLRRIRRTVDDDGTEHFCLLLFKPSTLRRTAPQTPMSNHSCALPTTLAAFELPPPGVVFVPRFAPSTAGQLAAWAPLWSLVPQPFRWYDMISCFCVALVMVVAFGLLLEW